MTAAANISPEDLSDHSLLQGLSPEERSVIADICRRVHVEQDEHLIEEGATGRDLFVLCSGTVRVEAGDSEGNSRRLATLEPGAMIGELALVVGRPRSANVIAREDCTLVRLDAEAFLKLRRSESLVAYKLEHNILEHLIDRQRDINEQLLNWIREHESRSSGRNATDDIAQLRELADEWMF